MLEKYLQEFKVNPFVDEFFAVSSRQPAVMLERISRWGETPPEFTLEEVVTDAPWHRK